MRELILYTDESEKSGKYYENFYGGAVVRSKDLEPVQEILSRTALENNLLAEIKWSKVTENYLGKYKALVDAFFDLVAQDRIKVRIMFTQTRFIATNLTPEHRRNEYLLLYYQFLRHGFGLRYCTSVEPGPVRLRIYLDKLPDSKENIAKFKGFVTALQFSKEFRDAGVLIPLDQIAEVRSHDHVILQCLDVVLGAMQFRLNDRHLEKPEGQTRRGKKTIAKEKLYKHINARIRGIYPHFNIGVSTGTEGDWANRWHHPYRHWLFIPSERKIDNTRAKHR
ncbi:MAG TPA: DUF3800 domain-containing protein [Longimicrobiaceae bacterium]|nr:DUF3800 domain-containing protein [Longimicrobiaceae bacterium]